MGRVCYLQVSFLATEADAADETTRPGILRLRQSEHCERAIRGYLQMGSEGFGVTTDEGSGDSTVQKEAIGAVSDETVTVAICTLFSFCNDHSSKPCS